MASKKKVAKQVRILQWAISIFIILSLACSTAVFIYKDLKYSDVHNNIDRFHRLEYLSKTAKQMSWAFLTLAIGLAASVIFLVKSVQREMKFFSADHKQFKSEFCRMYWMLIIFSLTYFCRWVSDYWIVPSMTYVDYLNPFTSDDTKMKPCVLSDGLPTLCLSFEFQIYYMGSSLLFDLIPLGLIAIFHYLSFRNVDSELRNSSLDTAERRQHEKIQTVNDTLLQQMDHHVREASSFHTNPDSLVGAVLFCAVGSHSQGSSSSRKNKNHIRVS